MSLKQDTIERPVSAAQRARHAYSDSARVVGEEDRIVKYLPLVKSIVDRMKVRLPAHVDLDDLASAGVGGLIVAAQKFDPEQGCVFEAYARRRIQGAILDELRRMDPMSRTARRRAREVMAAVAEVESRLGRPAESREVAAEMGMPVKDYEKVLAQVRPFTFLPLDSTIQEDDGRPVSLHEVIPDDSQPGCAESLEKKETIAALTERLASLPERQRQVLVMYYHKEMRLAEIAAVFNVTEARISQIHSQALINLRVAFAKAAEGAKRAS